MKKLYYKVSAVMLAVIMCFCILLPENIPKVKAAETYQITRGNEYTYGNYGTASHKYTINGKTVVCCEHKKAAAYGTATREIMLNADIAKVLYYGNGGYKEWNGFDSTAHAVVATAILVDAYYNGTLNSMSANYQSITQSFRAFLATAAPAPTPYIWIYRTNDSNMQDLVGYDVTFEQGKISVKKTDPSGRGLAGARFKATNTSTGFTATFGPTDSSGYAIIGDIPYGTYSVEEIQAPAGYKLSTETWIVTVSPENNGAASFTAVNEPSVGSVQIIKTSSDGPYYARNIEFTLTGGNLTAPLKGKTDTNGKLLFSDLQPGTYTVTETVPDKYKPQAPQTVTVKSGETATVNFANIVKTGTVKGKKVDHLGNPLAGAQIGIFTINTTSVVGNEAVQRMYTGADGVFEFTNVPYGQYFVAELNPPNGYILNTTKYYVDILADGAVVEIEIENVPKPKEIEVLKTDSTSNVLAGVIFALETSSDGGLSWEKIEEVPTDKRGKACFLNLVPGVYYRITEIKTIDEFQLLAEPIFEGQLSVTDKEVITITAINAPEFELPPTGGNSFLYVPIGIGLAMGAVIVIYYLLKKERRGKEI